VVVIRELPEFSILDRQQVVRPHYSCHALVIHHHPASAQFCRDSSISVVALVFQSNLLNSRSHCHVLFLRDPTFKVAVEPRSADLGQLAHSLDTQTALQRHLEFRRRRLLARDTALLASSLDFLQGTSEKIHLYRFVRQ
jgi:hypothetical protein